MVDYVKERARAVLEKLKLQSYYRDTFANPQFHQGERVLAHICHVGFVNRPTFVAGDPYATAHNEGMRRLALSILHHAHRNPAEYARQLEQQVNGIDSTE